MKEVLYQLMDWERIEAIAYSEEAYPQHILGAHPVENGWLVQTYQPEAESVSILYKGERMDMIEVDKDYKFFAYLLEDFEQNHKYQLEVTYQDGSTSVSEDPYLYGTMISREDQDRFSQGIHYEIYEKLGAHYMEMDGVWGTHFAVWAPNALRVSVVGDFNYWDGRIYPMRKHNHSGIFELFLPGVKPGAIYKYEIKTRQRLTYLKADPYARQAQLRPDNASIVASSATYEWSDKSWMSARKKKNMKTQPLNVYEVHLGSWKKPDDGREFFTYHELAPMLAQYVKDLGFNAIELLPIMEHPFDGSWGYQVTGYYAPTARYGQPEDFKYFVDYMHSEGISVILDWVPAHFPKDTFGLSAFDGTYLYEHQDKRQGEHPHWGTLIYNYGRPQVSNFLLANALYWIKEFHVDGLRFDAVASMLYLDYGKQDGGWVANAYGGNENLEAIEFFKHLNSIHAKMKTGALMIAEESTAYPLVTSSVEEGGLGFDLKWNMGWMNDFLEYMKLDPYFKSYHHNELTFSMVYAYSEDYILSLSHDEVVHGKGTLLNKMPGLHHDKLANLRAAYGYTYAHPGKKLLFMGQEFGPYEEWNENKALPWECLDVPDHQEMLSYMKALNQLYHSEPALYQQDHQTKGFEWLDSSDYSRSILAFVRKSRKKADTLVILVNFTPVTYEDYQFGVPYPGKYKEIFNSQNKVFGGHDIVNKRVKSSKAEEVHNRKHSIEAKLGALSFSVWKYQGEDKKVKKESKDK